MTGSSIMAGKPNHEVTKGRRKPRRACGRLQAGKPQSQNPLPQSDVLPRSGPLDEQVRTEELRATIRRLQDDAARRKLAESKVRKRSQMLEAFFLHTITPLAFLDRSFNFIRVNDAYARADGKTPKHFVGKNYFSLYPDTAMQEMFEQVVRTGRLYLAHARPLAGFGGPHRVRYWNWQLTPLLNDSGEVGFLVFNLEDVTNQQEALRELVRRTHQLQKLTLELSQVEDRERKRLAEILHDDLQQVLAAARFHQGILSARVRGDANLEDLAGQVGDLLKEAIGKSRSLSHELSPPALHQSKLGETFEWLARQFQATHGLLVHVEIRGRIDPQSETLRAFLYKAGREMLFNVVKHAGVREARLRLQHIRRCVWLTISDKGRGFDPCVLGKAGGFGLLSIRERVQLLGGRMKIRAAAGRGSTFLLLVPDHESDSTDKRTVGRAEDARGTMADCVEPG
jgi:signal transduction histidine kinase